MATSDKESKKNIQDLISKGVSEDYIKSKDFGEHLNPKEAAKILDSWNVEQDKKKAEEQARIQAEEQARIQQEQERLKNIPDEIKNDPSFKSLPADQQDIVVYNYKIQKENDAKKAQALATALEQATAQSDPYFKNIIRVAQDEVLRGIEEANGDYTSSVERQKRRIEEIQQDLARGKEYLTLEQQAELANLSADLQDKVQTFERNVGYLGAEKAAQLQKLELDYNKSVDTINANLEYTEAEKKSALDKLAKEFQVNQENLTQGAANVGLTFSTKRKIAEQRLKEENLGLMESTERQYNKQRADLQREAEYLATQKSLEEGNIERDTAMKLAEQQQSMETAQRQTEASQEQLQREYTKRIADLEIEASRGNTEAQAEIDDLKRKLNESITGIGRSAETYLGTEAMPTIEGYQPLGGVTGTIEEEKVKDIATRSDVIYNELTQGSLTY